MIAATSGSGVSSRTIGSDDMPDALGALGASVLGFCELPFVACTALALVVFMLEVILAAGFFSTFFAAVFFAGAAFGFATGFAGMFFVTTAFLTGVDALLSLALDTAGLPFFTGVVLGGVGGLGLLEEDCLPGFLRARFCLARRPK